MDIKNKILCLLFFFFISNYIYAADCNGVPCSSLSGKGSAVDVNSTVSSGSQSSNLGQATNSGVTQNIINRGADGVKYSGGYTIETVPGVAAPALTTTLTDT